MNNQIVIFDTTLRDGEQALQASLSLNEKLQIARALERVGVDVIEAGFPVSSPGDFESVSKISQDIRNSQICALARCVSRDIEAAGEALKKAASPRLHVFVATSKLHADAKLKRTSEEIREMAIASIKDARNFCHDVEFSCEDAGRTTRDDLRRIVEAAINAGAKTINIPDTVGFTLPSQFKAIITDLYHNVPNIDKAIISVHCHDDLGLSVANSISAIEAGARQIEGTFNGLGERAGNCALEEVIMSIKLHQKDLGVTTNINCKEIARTSRTISQICSVPIPAHKAIIGSNAYSHSSGIHQDGVIKNRETYEIISPESIGLKTTRLNLTSRSGRAAIKNAMSEMGYKDDQYNLDHLYQNFLKLGDKKGQIFDYDLEALAFIGFQATEEKLYNLKSISYQSKNNKTLASIILNYNNKDYTAQSNGNGPVDAVFHAILDAFYVILDTINFPIKLISFNITAKGIGQDALGQADIVISYKGRHFHGTGIDTDTVEAAALAFIDSINHIMCSQRVARHAALNK